MTYTVKTDWAIKLTLSFHSSKVCNPLDLCIPLVLVFSSMQGPPLEPLPPPPRLPTPAETMETARRKASLGVMQASTHIKPSPTYRPRPAWVSRPPSTVSNMVTFKKWNTY